MAATEELKKLIPAWLDDVQIEHLYQLLEMDLEQEEFARLARDPKNWKRESKRNRGQEVDRILDCRPLESALKLAVATNQEDQILKHAFLTNYEGCVYDDDEEEAEFYQESGATYFPSDYYFKAEPMPDDNLGQTMVLICPKKFFDANGHCFDQHLSQDAGGPLSLGPKLEELAEASFAFDGTVAEAETYLQKLGMTLNSKIC